MVISNVSIWISNELTTGVTGRYWMLTSDRQLTPPLVHVYTGARVCPILYFVLMIGVMILIIVRYLHIS